MISRLLNALLVFCLIVACKSQEPETSDAKQAASAPAMTPTEEKVQATSPDEKEFEKICRDELKGTYKATPGSKGGCECKDGAYVYYYQYLDKDQINPGNCVSYWPDKYQTISIFEARNPNDFTNTSSIDAQTESALTAWKQQCRLRGGKYYLLIGNSLISSTDKSAFTQQEIQGIRRNMYVQCTFDMKNAAPEGASYITL